MRAWIALSFVALSGCISAEECADGSGCASDDGGDADVDTDADSDSDADADSDSDSDADSDSDTNPTCEEIGGTCDWLVDCGDGCAGPSTPAGQLDCESDVCCVPPDPEDSCEAHGGHCVADAACPEGESSDPGWCANDGDVCCVVGCG